MTLPGFLQLLIDHRHLVPVLIYLFVKSILDRSFERCLRPP